MSNIQLALEHDDGRHWLVTLPATASMRDLRTAASLLIAGTAEELVFLDFSEVLNEHEMRQFILVFTTVRLTTSAMFAGTGRF